MVPRFLSPNDQLNSHRELPLVELSHELPEKSAALTVTAELEEVQQNCDRKLMVATYQPCLNASWKPKKAG